MVEEEEMRKDIRKWRGNPQGQFPDLDQTGKEEDMFVLFIEDHQQTCCDHDKISIFLLFK